MRTHLLRGTVSRTHARVHYPYDPAHPTRSYAQTQRDVGGSLLLGALVVAVLMILIVLGLT